MVGRTLARIVGFAARRPVPVLAVTSVLVLAGTVLALGLTPSAATDTLVGRGSPEYRASAHYHQKFGDDAVIVLVKGPLPKLVLTSDIERVLGLEGCISGNLPKDVTPRGGLEGPCGQLAKTKPVKVVYGPGTFINASVSQISDQFQAQQRQARRESKKVAEAARKLALARGMSQEEADKLADEAAQLRQAQFLRDIIRLGLKYGLSRPPTLNDTQFVSKLVFANAAQGTPKTRFAYLFPNKNSALVQVRLKPTLSEAERKRAIKLIREAVAMPDWRLNEGGRYVVTGAPVVVSDLTDRISRIADCRCASESPGFSRTWISALSRLGNR